MRKIEIFNNRDYKDLQIEVNDWYSKHVHIIVYMSQLIINTDSGASKPYYYYIEYSEADFLQ